PTIHLHVFVFSPSHSVLLPPLFPLLRRPPCPTLFPYTTLFRSGAAGSTGTTTAVTRWPHSGSGRPTTTASATAGSARSRAFTCAGTTLWPPVLITSSCLPRTLSRPLSSRPRSLVRTHRFPASPITHWVEDRRSL